MHRTLSFFKPLRQPHTLARLAAAALAGGAGLCAAQNTIQPFTTDGCSLFPDRALIGQADWCHCCVAHDIAYWRGGTAPERLQADRDFSACVQQASGSKTLAELMNTGVRAGGSPYFNTPYRWGYGWAYGRGYTPLSTTEQTHADAQERAYRHQHPQLICPSVPTATSAPVPASVAR